MDVVVVVVVVVVGGGGAMCENLQVAPALQAPLRKKRQGGPEEGRQEDGWGVGRAGRGSEGVDEAGNWKLGAPKK